MLDKNPPSRVNLIPQRITELMTLLSEEGLSTDLRKLREIQASIQTGCRPNSEKSGPDCFYQEDGQWHPAERKSCITKNINGSYTGISVKTSWEEQVEYLNTKVKAMGRHYFDRFDPFTGALVESWYLTGQQVFDIILPTLKKAYPTTLDKADPRLSAGVCMTKIKQYGTKVI